MAVNHSNSSQAAKIALASPGNISARNHRGRIRTINDAGAFAAGSEVGSTISFGKISTSAVLLGTSRVHSDALGASTTLNFGVKNNTAAGVSSKTAAFISGGTVGASAASLNGIAAVDINKTGQQIWQILGLSADPKVDLDLVVTLAGATTSAGGDVAIELQIVED